MAGRRAAPRRASSARPSSRWPDVRFISPDLPDMTGRATAIAKWETRTRTAYDLANLVLMDGPERIEGSLVAEVDSARGLGRAAAQAPAPTR